MFKNIYYFLKLIARRTYLFGLIITALFIMYSSVFAYGGTQIVATNYCELPRTTYYEVALPNPKAKLQNKWVKITYKGKVAIAPVLDVGPQNTYDDYWNSGTDRDMFQNLSLWMPEAEWVLGSDQGFVVGGGSHRQPAQHYDFIGMSDFYTNPDDGSNFYRSFTNGRRYIGDKNPRTYPEEVSKESNWRPITTNAGIDFSAGVWKHLDHPYWNRDWFRDIVSWEFTDEIPKSEIKDLKPIPSSVISKAQPEISARIEDIFSGVDIGSTQPNNKVSVAKVEMFISHSPGVPPQKVNATWTPDPEQGVGIDTGIISYTMSSPLADGIYEVKIACTNNAGQTSESQYSFTLNAQPPQITNISPKLGAVGVPYNANIVVTFSKPVNPASLEGCIQVSGSSVNPSYFTLPATFTSSPDGKTYTFHADDGRIDFAVVRITDKVMDFQGNKLDGDRDGVPGGNYPLSFSVGGEEITDDSDFLYVPSGKTYNLSGSHNYLNAVEIEGVLYIDGIGSLELNAPDIFTQMFLTSLI